ncbi:pentapeptide repeat-containing protein [Corynebacterium diphtheriae]|nr:pentapeptide repeat-containing protein [Corynebacterium diphtheriae]CAB0927348.1 pentapeptide repeat-containing protein [Corynebacterium diphtheriae]
MTRMTRAEVEKIVAEARVENKTPNLQGANLRFVDLCGADLQAADLRGADLRGATLQGADLRFADLRFADLRFADLRGANLRGDDLRGANLRFANLRDAGLRGANLWGANLRDAGLRGANLWGANLRGANLYDCIWDGLQITQPPYGQVILTPTCKGWWMSIGCWDGTPEELKTLISKDEGGIEAGDENHLPCSYLEAVFALCEAYMKDNAKIIDDLKGIWGDA